MIGRLPSGKIEGMAANVGWRVHARLTGDEDDEACVAFGDVSELWASIHSNVVASVGTATAIASAEARMPWMP